MGVRSLFVRPLKVGAYSGKAGLLHVWVYIAINVVVKMLVVSDAFQHTVRILKENYESVRNLSIRHH